MKKTAALILAAFFIIGGATFAANPKAKTNYIAFTPSGANKSLFLKSGADQHRYFIVEKGGSFGFDVVGPTTIKIRTRAELKAGVKDVEYEMQVWENDKTVVGRKVKSKPSMLIAEGQNIGIGVARTVSFKVPKGKHSYRLWIKSDVADRFYARFYQAKKIIKKAEFNDFKPFEFKKQVTLTSATAKSSYYMVDANGGVKLSVVGPTKLQIYCRASFSKDMKGRAKFTLGMFESGKQAAQFPSVAKASTKVQFKEMGDLIPSDLQVFAFEVPAGKHLYDLKVVDSASPGLALRFKIMKAGLGMIP